MEAIIDNAMKGEQSVYQLEKYTNMETMSRSLYFFEDVTGTGHLGWKDTEQEAWFKVQGYVSGYMLPSALDDR